MGRPVRYGGEKGGVEARTKFVVGAAEEALKPLMVEDSGSFRRYIKHVPLGGCPRYRAVELSIPGRRSILSSRH